MFSVKNTFIFEIIYKSLFQKILFFFLFLPEIAYWGVVWIYKLTKCNKVKTLRREVKLVSYLCRPMCYAMCNFVLITCEITTRVFPKIFFFFFIQWPDASTKRNYCWRSKHEFNVNVQDLQRGNWKLVSFYPHPN